MKTIQQFQLLPGMRLQTLRIPEGATVVRVASLGGVIGLWATVDDIADLVTRTFRLYENDQEIAAADEYLGTVPMIAGSTKHVFVEPVA